MLNKWQELSPETRSKIINNVSNEIGISPVAIEKDWWVTMVLKAIFNLSFADMLVFKGGTSLSKGWNIIERFSEDIDISIDRKFFKFNIEAPSVEQINKLRDKSRKFVKSQLCEELQRQLIYMGIVDFDIKREINSQDPQVIRIEYRSVLSMVNDYINPWIKLEIGVRFNYEPFEKRQICSILSSNETGSMYCDERFNVNAVFPTATFLEKIFLLHEAWIKSNSGERMSRHLYDLERIMNSSFYEDVLNDIDLYVKILKHRASFVGLKDIDYKRLHPSTIDFIPSDTDMLKVLERDYREMVNVFIYGESLSFKQLMAKMSILKDKIRTMETNDTFFKN